MTYFEKEKEQEQEEDYNEFNFILENINKLSRKLGYTEIIVNRLDYYGNTIPFGAFCNAVSFILYGFYRCEALSYNDTFLWGIILIFGGIGQITCGLLEFLKGRSFPSMIYLCYGFYCLSHYFLYMLPLKFVKYNIIGINFNENSLCAFYGAWAIISLPITIASIRTNLFFTLQCQATSVFFILRCFGEGFCKNSVARHSAGILQVIAGFISLYICISQLVNDQFGYQFFPAVPFTPDNDIDFTRYSKVE